MPTYCYVTDDGERFEQTLSLTHKPPLSMRINGKIALRDYRAENVAVPPTAGWPITCYASGVHPDQAGELRDYLAKKGVPTEVTKEGDPVYTSQAHQTKALRARGMHNKDSNH